jgi:Domain of unknown function (DUF6456)
MLTPWNPATVPVVGALMVGPKGHGAFYRVDHVVLLRQAGGTERRRYRLRLSITRLRPTDDAPALPWRLGVPLRPLRRRDAVEQGDPPPLDSPLLAQLGVRDRAMVERLQHKAPLLFAQAMEPISGARDRGKQEQQARAARVGRDHGVVNLCDQGHSARTDVDVDVSAADPTDPDRRIRRAFRTDPLDGLRRRNTITSRQFNAAEALRSDIEAAIPGLGGATQSEVHAAPWDRASISDNQVNAAAAVRLALAPLGPHQRLVLTWMCCGGTVSGVCLYAGVSQHTVIEQLRAALDKIVSHYLGDREQC